jgi:transposase
LQADDVMRIAHVRAPRWISHPAAGAAHDAMRLLLERPPSLRPRGLLLAGPYHNGKTMIAERFAVEHLRVADQQEVWVIQTREGAGLSHFYASILSGLRAPQAAGWRSLSRAGDQVDHLLERLKPRLLIFDEFHSALRGRRQDVKAIFSFLRRIARVHDISPVLVGEIAIYDAVHNTDEMGSRFDTIPIPRWAYDEDFATLLDSLEASLPLANASELSREPLAKIIHDLSEGLIGEVVEIVTRAAVAAIAGGEDRITGATLSDLGYVPLSRRRNSAVALPFNRFCLNLCGATILSLEHSGGIVVISKKHWSPGSDVSVQGVKRRDSGGWLVSGVLAPRGICPDCGLHSRRRHGWRQRRLQDLPALGDKVTIALWVCRWRCRASTCPRRTFSDYTSSIARPFARRTSRADDIVVHLGHATGGRPAERLLRRLGVGVSNDTVLRHLKKCAESVAPPPTVIGIDDWSWRKSQTYGTIIVDLERQTVIDILPDRSVESCASWLRQHPEIEVISRDRCGGYAKAARQGAPQALQVADRFHLVQNLRQAIEEQMNMHGRATGRALLSDAENISTANHLLRSRLAHRKSREEIFRNIHALRDQGLSCSEIGRRTGFPRRSVAKWLSSDSPPDRRRAALKPTSPWYFESILADLWKQGIRSGQELLVEIQRHGYEGSLSHLQRLLAGWRRDEQTVLAGPTDTPLPLAPVRDPQTGHAISPVVAAALCIKPRRKLTADQAQKVDALKAGSPSFATMRSLAMRFQGILRGDQSAPLDAWIDLAIETGIPPIMRFARTLHRDIEAVRNAIELPWSNGQAEGQVNRLKTLKRAMYGRAGPELLRARMLPLRHTD